MPKETQSLSDACFTGDYPTRLTDQNETAVEDQFEMLAERVV